MARSDRVLWSVAVALLVCAGAAQAEIFTVTLANGSALETRYRPKLTSEGKVMLFTDQGNWISLAREEVEGVVSRTEQRGFGLVVDTTTISLGFAPNERQAVEDESQIDPSRMLLNYLTRQDRGSDYSVPQFVTVEEASGIPIEFTDRLTPPLGDTGEPQQ